MASAARMDRWGSRDGSWRGLFLTPRVSAALAAVLALSIFVVDVATPAQFAVAVLYVMVVLLVGTSYRRRAILLVATGCGVLVFLSFALTHGFAADRNALLRCLMSIAAIAVTTALVLRNESVTTALAERVRLLDLTHDTVSARDMTNVITYWNRGAEELYGWSREEAVGQIMHDLLRTVFPAPLQDIMVELQQTGRWEGELVHSKRDGSQVDVASRWYLQRDRQGQPIAILETNNDIADRKHADREALHHRQELQLTVDSIPVPVWSSLPDGTPDYANARWEETGYSGDDILRDWRAYNHPDDVERVENLSRASRLSGQPIEVEHRLRRRDGAYRWHLSRSIPRRNEVGAITRWYGVSIDIEDRKLAERSLQLAHAELAHLTRVTTMGELAASIAHEVNQPLAGVITHGEACLRWLDRAEPELGEVRTAVECVIADGRRAAEVIRKLRALAKRTEIRPTPERIDEILEDALALVQREIANHRVVLDVECAADLPLVAVDRIHLQQVLINLVLNAIQAMGGIADRTRQLLVRAAIGEPGQVHLEVRDSGVGIDPAVSGRLFEPFFTTKDEGMGMGLAISRTIVEAHGGRIWVTGHEGPGANFHVALPVAPTA